MVQPADQSFTSPILNKLNTGPLKQDEILCPEIFGNGVSRLKIGWLHPINSVISWLWNFFAQQNAHNLVLQRTLSAIENECSQIGTNFLTEEHANTLATLPLRVATATDEIFGRHKSSLENIYWLSIRLSGATSHANETHLQRLRDVQDIAFKSMQKVPQETPLPPTLSTLKTPPELDEAVENPLGYNDPFPSLEPGEATGEHLPLGENIRPPLLPLEPGEAIGEPVPSEEVIVQMDIRRLARDIFRSTEENFSEWDRRLDEMRDASHGKNSAAINFIAQMLQNLKLAKKTLYQSRRQELELIQLMAGWDEGGAEIPAERIQDLLTRLESEEPRNDELIQYLEKLLRATPAGEAEVAMRIGELSDRLIVINPDGTIDRPDDGACLFHSFALGLDMCLSVEEFEAKWLSFGDLTRDIPLPTHTAEDGTKNIIQELLPDSLRQLAVNAMLAKLESHDSDEILAAMTVCIDTYNDALVARTREDLSGQETISLLFQEESEPLQRRHEGLTKRLNELKAIRLVSEMFPNPDINPDEPRLLQQQIDSLQAQINQLQEQLEPLADIQRQIDALREQLTLPETIEGYIADPTTYCARSREPAFFGDDVHLNTLAVLFGIQVKEDALDGITPRSLLDDAHLDPAHREKVIGIHHRGKHFKYLVEEHLPPDADG